MAPTSSRTIDMDRREEHERGPYPLSQASCCSQATRAARAQADLLRAEARMRSQRTLRAPQVVYYVMAMTLYAQSSYEEVMRHLVEGLSWLTHWRKGWQVPSKVAI